MPMPNTSSKVETKTGILRWAGKMVSTLLIYGTILFAASGRFAWREGWAYFGVIFFTQLLTAILLIPQRPDLISERSKLQEGTKKWDRYMAPIVAVIGPLTIIVTAGLDQRFGWSAPINNGFWLFGLIFSLGGGLFILWSMVSNPFFAATVRIQSDRGHTVISRGPYRLVRHPGYLGSIIFDLATPIALGSWWTFLPAFITVVLLFIRTGLEDHTLRIELSGYQQYTEETRYRLIPGIW